MAGPVLVVGLAPEGDPAPVEFAFRTAVRLGLEVRAVRAFQPATACDGAYVDDVEVGRRDAMVDMGVMLRPIRDAHPGVPVTIEAYCGDPVSVLAKAARYARLLVVGSGRTATELLARNGTPIVVVPNETSVHSTGARRSLRR